MEKGNTLGGEIKVL